MDAGEAHRWGLVNEITSADNLLTRAREVARRLAEGPPLVFAAIKETVRATENMDFQESIDMLNAQGLATVRKLYNSEDMREGALAFSEKREPVWKGR